ncbi:prenyltransferase [Microlunatus parietis]|uniref:Chlorophyll synthase n=1 Tax=Microlunatus parietis TaxID=682979 RepID=A0A7Y9IC12_9ACTN|nr:prenyltransferase [Microlunatus parietis]NYE73912.1 chlorophyll synthase [Microlunatus parietis]
MIIGSETPEATRRPLSGASAIGVRHRAAALLAMARPQFWLVSLVALHLGFVLATRRLVPTGAEAATLAYAGLIAGPLIWLAVLAINDAHDQGTDRRNPRKAGAPLVTGVLDRRQAIAIGIVSGAVAVLASIPLGGLFTLGVGLTVLLGWAYSTPPLRLKARPGVDVALNAFAVAVLGPLGGWVALTGTITGFPWPMALIGSLAVAALYLPTTLVDRQADRAAGARTTAVALGERATFELGFALWAGSAVVAAVLAATGTVLDSSLLPLHLIMAPILLVTYRVLLRHRPGFGAITIVAATFLVPCTAFVLTYCGVITGFGAP